MATTNNVLAKSAGGGAPAYGSGKEVPKDLSSASYAAASTDMKKVFTLFSTTDGKTFTLPSLASGVAQGSYIGIRVQPRSRPIRILNPGTPGTDPVLEAFLLPGADYVFFAMTVGTAVGNWQGTGRGGYHGPVPVTLPLSIDAGVDFGSVVLVNNMRGINTLSPNTGLTRMDNTHYAVAAMPAAGTSIVAYAQTYNHATDAWTWGAAQTMLSSANQWTQGGIIGFATPSFAVAAFETTAAKASIRGATVSGTTITVGTTNQSGAWVVNPVSPVSASTCTLVADSANTFFYACHYDGSGHLGVIHFSGMGTANVVQDGGGAFASTAMLDTVPLFGFSPSANVIDLGLDNAGSTFGGVARYTYAAAAVTNTFNLVLSNAISNLTGPLQCADATNKVYYVFSSNSATMTRCRINAGNTDFAELIVSQSATTTDNTIPAAIPAGQTLIISDDEALAYATPGPGGRVASLTLYNPQLVHRARYPIVPQAGADSGFATHVVAATAGFFTNLKAILGADFNSSNRRLAIFYTSFAQSIVSGRKLRMQMFDVPRNYDQAIS